MQTTEKTYRKFIRIPSDDGKRHRVAVTAKSERELEIKYREKIIELARTNHRYAKSVTVENYFPHYMEGIPCGFIMWKCTCVSEFPQTVIH